MTSALFNRLKRDAAKARERIESIEVHGFRWRQIGKQGQESDVTKTILAEAKERLADAEQQISRMLGKDDR